MKKKFLEDEIIQLINNDKLEVKDGKLVEKVNYYSIQDKAQLKVISVESLIKNELREVNKI